MTNDKIMETYKTYKDYAKKAIGQSKINDAILSIEHACMLAYTYNFHYVDYKLENLVKQMSNDYYSKIKNKDLKKNKIIFYDCFLISSCGLTRQYIRSLVKLNYDILVIVPKSESLVDKKLKDELISYKSVSIKYIELTKNNVSEQITKAIKIIENFAPSKAFLHMAPWDVFGNIVWNVFPSIERYQINFTDHAFWLGVNCADYFIEFRNYGYNISKNFREIPESKIYVLPYYPIYDSAPYEGLPLDNKYLKLFSGGSMYKILGYNLKFLDIIKDILIRHTNVIFYFAGSGDSTPMEAIIEKYNLKDRWILLGHRKDVVEVMKHIDIYIGTYPIGGGLMSQIAAAAAIPCVCYCDPKLLNFSNVDQLFNRKNDFKISYTDLNDFNSVVDQLVYSKELRGKMGETLKTVLPTKEDFNDNLERILNKTYDYHNTFHQQISADEINEINKLYLGINNRQPYVYYRLNINKVCAKVNVFLFIQSIVCYAYYIPKKHLIKRINEKIKNKLKVVFQ